MKREVTKKVEKAKNLTEPLYHKAVDALAAAYSRQHKMHEKDIKAFAKRLKGEWKNVARAANKKVKKTARAIKKKIR